jgi:hypothetical protein
MDEEPIIIAAMMTEQEKHRQGKKAIEGNINNSYQQFPYNQPAGESIIGWIVIGVIVIILYLLIRS